MASSIRVEQIRDGLPTNRFRRVLALAVGIAANETTRIASTAVTVRATSVDAAVVTAAGPLDAAVGVAGIAIAASNSTSVANVTLALRDVPAGALRANISTTSLTTSADAAAILAGAMASAVVSLLGVAALRAKVASIELFIGNVTMVDYGCTRFSDACPPRPFASQPGGDTAGGIDRMSTGRDMVGIAAP
jgi:hypothetical protein